MVNILRIVLAVVFGFAGGAILFATFSMGPASFADPISLPEFSIPYAVAALLLSLSMVFLCFAVADSNTNAIGPRAYRAEKK